MPGNNAPIVREMTRADIAVVSTIENESYPFPWAVGIFRDCMLSGHRCRVLANETGLLGYAVMAVAANEAHILNLCIAPAERRQGAAKTLLGSLLDEARGAAARRVFLEVRPDNQAARRLYEWAGFEQIGVRPNYYPTETGRGNALVLALELTTPTSRSDHA